MLNEQIKVRNCSVDIFRYICAIMVVSIHTHPFADLSDSLGYIFDQVVPRIGVPFFFCISGYFYIQKLEKGQTAYIKYMAKLLTTYSVWSCIYFAVDFFMWGHKSVGGFIINCFRGFLLSGSYYHFWFFPALMILVTLTTVVYKIGLKKVLVPVSILLYAIGCLGCSYYGIGVKIPYLGRLLESENFDLIRRIFLMGFPFFICGHVVNKLKCKVFDRVSKKGIMGHFFLAVIIFIAEIVLVHGMKWQRTLVTTFGLYWLVVITIIFLLQNPFIGHQCLSDKSRVIANFTYYSHPLIILAIEFLLGNVLSTSVTETPMFLLTVLTTYLIGTLIYKLNNKFVNVLAN